MIKNPLRYLIGLILLTAFLWGADAGVFCFRIGGEDASLPAASVDGTDSPQEDGSQRRSPIFLLTDDGADSLPFSKERRTETSRSNPRTGEKTFERIEFTLIFPYLNRLGGDLMTQRREKSLSPSPFSSEPLYLAHAVLLI